MAYVLIPIVKMYFYFLHVLTHLKLWVVVGGEMQLQVGHILNVI